MIKCYKGRKSAEKSEGLAKEVKLEESVPEEPILEESVLEESIVEKSDFDFQTVSDDVTVKDEYEETGIIIYIDL